MHRHTRAQCLAQASLRLQVIVTRAHLHTVTLQEALDQILQTALT